MSTAEKIIHKIDTLNRKEMKEVFYYLKKKLTVEQKVKIYMKKYFSQSTVSTNIDAQEHINKMRNEERF